MHNDEQNSVVEVSLKSNNRLVVENGEVIQHPKYANGVLRLLVIKNKHLNSTKAVLMLLKADEINNADEYSQDGCPPPLD